MPHDKNVFGRINPYSSPFEELDGKCYKYFVRFNDNKSDFDKSYMEAIDRNVRQVRGDDVPIKTIEDSCVFRELWTSLNQEHCNYEVYCRELIEGGYIPKYVSCLVKENNVFGNLKECIGSRLANYMGINTVFNMMQGIIVSSGEASANGFELNDINLISVDFIPDEYNFASLEHLNMDIQPNDSLERNLKVAGSMWFFFMAKKLNIKLDRKQIDDFERDFSMQYLFRRCLCNEGDYKAKNIGVLYSKDGKCFHLAPSFDMEFLFCDHCPTTEEDLTFINKKYPAELLGFIKMLERAFEEDAFNKIIDRMPKYLLFKEEMEKIKVMLNANARRICDYYNNILNNSNTPN